MFAEIRWALKQVFCGYSDNSCEGTVNLFGVVFPDSVRAVNDQLTVAKLSLFIYVAGILKPYLKKYQTDMPMIPYICMMTSKRYSKPSLSSLLKHVIAKCQT